MINVTVKVEGPVGSGKSRVMDIIIEALKNADFALTDPKRGVPGVESVVAMKEYK